MKQSQLSPSKQIARALCGCLLLGLAACGKQEPETQSDAEQALELDSLEQKVSYGIGYNMGSQLAQDPSLDPQQDQLFAGIKDALAGSDRRLSQEEIFAAFQEFQTQAHAEQAALAEKVKAESADFLASNAKRSEVTTTDSGLQYEVLVQGDGPKPTLDQTVQVHYHGTLPDGTVFDSSVDRGEPIEFAVTGVIRGWTEALQLMPQGSKWMLYIPSDLAYGDQGRPSIPGGSALVFEVELLDIK